MRRHVFQGDDVAQTPVARLNAIVIRQDDRYHLLADSAFTEYLWSCLIDAMAEFKGSIAGCGHVIAAQNLATPQSKSGRASRLITSIGYLIKF